MLALLPTVDSPPPSPRPSRRLRALLVHLLRIGMFAAIILVIHRNHARRSADADAATVRLSLSLAKKHFPKAASVAPGEDGVTSVLDAAGEPLGRMLQTSPQSDGIIGFSGPTNVLLAFDTGDRVIAAEVLSSRDTREHAERVMNDPRFLSSYIGRLRDEAASLTQVDAVTGATLTSLAIAESIVHRLGGRERSLRFPDPLAPAAVKPLFPDAARLEPEHDLPSLWRVYDGKGRELGAVLRGSPAIDNLVGYQGPTDVLIGLQPAGGAESAAGAPPDASGLHDWEVSGVAVGRSYDNEPYVGYVRDDRYYFRLFTGRSLLDLSQMDLQAEGVEGVSGATMTSMAVAEGLVAAARRQLADAARVEAARKSAAVQLTTRDIGTALVTVLGVTLGLSSWRGRALLRIPFLLVLVFYLGFLNADLVSQALLAGWAQNGAPWRKMIGPLVLVTAAVTTPILTRSNIYCSHLCPHGAAQQLLMSRLRWRVRLGPRLHRFLSCVPALLLAWSAIVAIGGITFSLVDIEPFDAYVPTIAGWPALTIFAVGLIAALFVPMAYCQYGCPTGALLGWLRRHGRSDALGWGDLIAFAALVAGFILG